MTGPESPCDPRRTPHPRAPQASSPEKQDTAHGEGMASWDADRLGGGPAWARSWFCLLVCDSASLSLGSLPWKWGYLQPTQLLCWDK